MTMSAAYPVPRDARWDHPSKKGAERARILGDVVSSLWQDQTTLREEMIRCARVYDNLPVLGLTPRLYRVRNFYPRSNRRRVPMNLVKGVCDTYVSLVTDSEPKLTWDTDDGDWELQRKAKLCEAFVDGVFYNASMYVTAPQVVRDSALFPFGVVKVTADESDPEDPRVRIERRFPWEILVDSDEALYGAPKRQYEVAFVEKAALAAEFPEHEDAIWASSLDGFADMADGMERVQESDFTAVVEGWALPRGGKPGLWAQACGGVLLDERPWRRKAFPHKFLYKSRPVQGIWSNSLVQDLMPIQDLVCRLLSLIERGIFSITGRWLVERNSDIDTREIDNVIASIVKYVGVPPQFVTGKPFDGSVMNLLEMMMSQAYELTGVSRTAASGQKPAGLSSGRAQLVYADTVAKRFTNAYRNYQHFFREVAQEVVAVSAEIAERHPGWGVKSQSLNKTIRWADAFLREEQYVIKLAPSNRLADDPAAKMEYAEKLLGTQMVSPDVGRRLLQNPDIKAEYELEDSRYNFVMSSTTSILEDGKYVQPDELMTVPELEQSIDLVRKVRWSNMLKRGVPKDRIFLLETWIQQASDVLERKKAEAAPPPPPPGAEGPPPGEGGPPPEGMPPPEGPPPV